MPRPAKHDETSILAAAASIAAARGPAAATIGAIGTAIGAPSGSIYHRFKTRDELLGRLWLSKAAFFQDRWAKALLQGTDAREAGLQAALSLPKVVRDDFAGARILLLHRREDFLSASWPKEIRVEADRLGAQVSDLLDDITRRLFGRNSSANRQAATFAVLDLPYSAVRRFVSAGEPPPQKIDALISKAYFAIIA